jgi:hypothetical protein
MRLLSMIGRFFHVKRDITVVRNITLVLAIAMAIGGSRMTLADDLQGQPAGLDQTSADHAARSTNPNSDKYHGFFFDLSEITNRRDFTDIVNGLRRQVDIVENVGLSQRVLAAFHAVPILVDEFGCVGRESELTSATEKPTNAGACYGTRVPGTLANGEDISNGVVIVRPLTLTDDNVRRPVLLHELLHFYHAHIFPMGVGDPTIRFYYKAAEGIYQNVDGYFLKNEKEFFAVTASIFLYGKADQPPFTRAQIQEKQPDYYKYLVWLFGFNPTGSPFASAE